MKKVIIIFGIVMLWLTVMGQSGFASNIPVGTGTTQTNEGDPTIPPPPPPPK